MTSTLFSLNNPPKMTGTTGIAYPKADSDLAACRVPEPTTMSTPWGQQVSATTNHWHQCLDVNKGDHYPNDEFNTYYEIRDTLDESDPRAKFLIDFWAERGHKVQVVLASKTKPARVVGIFDEDGTFEYTNTNGETGTAPFEPGDVLLGSPEIQDRVWVIKSATFAKKYQGITPNN